MPISSEQSVLRQKANRSDTPKRGNTGVFGRPLIRAAESELGLKLVVGSERSDKLGLQDVLDKADDQMFLVLDGPEGQTGAMLFDQGFVSQVTEFLTMGRIGPTVHRRMTRTDAALLQPFVDKALSRLHAADNGAELFRFGAFVPDAHGLGILLENTQFQLWTVQVDISEGENQADICLMLPQRRSTQKDAADAGQTTKRAPSLRATLMDTQVSVKVSLCTSRLSFDALRSLKPEDIIPLPSGALKQAALTCGGEHIADGTLGQLNGHRAVRISGQMAQMLHGPAQTTDVSTPQPSPGSELALPV